MKRVMTICGLAMVMTAAGALADDGKPAAAAPAVAPAAAPAAAPTPAVAAAPAAVMEQAVDARPSTVMVIYNPSKTKLDAYALTKDLEYPTGKKKFDNQGDYYGVIFDLPLQLSGFGLYGSYLTGKADEIQGGNFMAPDYDWTDWMNFSRANPLTGEEVTKIDICGTFELLGVSEAGRRGNLDVMAGYWNLDSRPMTSLANVYGGFSYGLKGAYARKVGSAEVCADGALIYVPSYEIAGNVEYSLSDEAILEYRAGLACLVGRYGLSVGYQGMRLTATAKKDGSDATVTLDGFYVGALMNF